LEVEVNMANEEQLAILRQGVEVWNKWRKENPDVKIDLIKADLWNDLHNVNLEGADLNGADLSGVNFHAVDLRGANLFKANLTDADLSDADLRRTHLNAAILRKAKLSFAHLNEARLYKADLSEADLGAAKLRGADLSLANLFESDLTIADLSGADLCGAELWGASLFDANLSNADLSGASLWRANLRGADLSEANLSGSVLDNANLVETTVSNAIISRSKVYGASIWDLRGEFKEQNELVITPKNTPVITVDNLEIAQFIYLVLNNQKIRDAINTLTSKAVLILGRFAIPERKAILDALRNKLREYNLLPIVFDFDRPTDKDFTETIKTLAGISYFVIADVTNPKSSPLELQATVPDYQIPFVPIIQEGESPFAMMVDLQKKYPWVMPTRSYDSIETLMSALKPGIIDPAVEMRNKLRQIKAQEHPTESLKDYLDKSL